MPKKKIKVRVSSKVGSMVINGVRFASGAEVMIDPKDYRPHLYDEIEPPAPKPTPPSPTPDPNLLLKTQKEEEAKAEEGLGADESAEIEGKKVGSKK